MERDSKPNAEGSRVKPSSNISSGKNAEKKRLSPTSDSQGAGSFVRHGISTKSLRQTREDTGANRVSETSLKGILDNNSNVMSTSTQNNTLSSYLLTNKKDVGTQTGVDKSGSVKEDESEIVFGKPLDIKPIDFRSIFDDEV
eukprot:IDg20854t1